MPMTHAATDTTKISAQYNRLVLNKVAVKTIYDTYAQSLTLETNGNVKKLFARRYIDLLPATVPLAEYDGTNIKAADSVTVTEEEIALDHYGAYIEITDEAEMYNLDKIKSKYLKLQSNQAKRTAEQIIKDKIYNGLAVVYAGTATTRNEVGAGALKMTPANFDLIIDKFTQQGGETIEEMIAGSTTVSTEAINEAYICICHHSMRKDLEAMTGFVKSINYGEQKTLPGEFGSYDKIRFIEDREGETVMDTNTTPNVILQGVVFAADAYATLTLKGSRNLRTIMHDASVVGGPLEQFSTIGWKMIMGAGILNQEWIVRIEARSPFTQTTKHYIAA